MATVQELIDHYVNLLIVQYHDKEKAKAHVSALINNQLANNIALDVRDAFDLEDAEGDQLTLLDKFVGVGRFHKGVELSDDDLRFLMKLKIIQNNSNHSIKSIDDSLYTFFEMDVIRVSEGSMHIAYFVEYGYDDVILTAFEKGIIPRPTGVKIDYIFSRPWEEQFLPYDVPFYPGLGQKTIDPTHKVMAISKEDGTYQNPAIEDGLDAGWFASEVEI